MIPDLKDTLLGVLQQNVNKGCFIRKDNVVKYFTISDKLISTLIEYDQYYEYFWLKSIFNNSKLSNISWKSIVERNLWNSKLTIMLYDNYAIVKQGKHEFKLTQTIPTRLY